MISNELFERKQGTKTRNVIAIKECKVISTYMVSVKTQPNESWEDSNVRATNILRHPSDVEHSQLTNFWLQNLEKGKLNFLGPPKFLELIPKRCSHLLDHPIYNTAIDFRISDKTKRNYTLAIRINWQVQNQWRILSYFFNNRSSFFIKSSIQNL